MNNEYDYSDFPLSYLITLRTYGSWLHGYEKLSVDKENNIYGTPKRDANRGLLKIMAEELKSAPMKFDERQRKAVESAIIEVCEFRKYQLLAINVRSNHLHVVVSAQKNPKLIADAFKSYSTRRLRADRLICEEEKVWARGRSRRYLWKPKHVSLAVEYVLYGQGEIIPEIFECPEVEE